jgi:hypothetical protein
MKKKILFSFAVLTAAMVTAQNSNRIQPTRNVKMATTFKSYVSEESHKNNYNVPNKINPAKKTSAAPYKRIGGSTNSYGVQSTEGRALTYNAAINTVGMILRKQAGWTIPTGDNSGTIVYAYTTNMGASWDSTILVANATKFMRHPAGTIYNPAGNTTPSNAYAVGSGPWHPGANWQGCYYASKKLSFPGNNTSGSSMFVDNTNLAATPGQKKQDFTRVDMQATTDGKVHVLGGLYKDINGTTAATQGFRGAMINKGTFNTNSFTWAQDSLKPSFKSTTGGNKHSYSSFNQSWSEDGQIGYVVFCGVDANAVAGTSMNSYQPYVYKTTNAGATWARHAPLFDFSTIPAIADRTFPTWNGIVKPFISIDEGSSATVDANGNLHFLASLVSSNSDHIDSLAATWDIDYASTWNYIVDYSTTSNGWCATVIDSLKSHAILSTETTWAVGYDARIQISRTTDGQKLVYSWADSDPDITTVPHLNELPNIFMKGYDVASNMLTATMDMTSTKVGPNYASFWHLVSPIIVNTSSTDYLVPTVYAASDDGANIGDNPISHYYIDDNTFTDADFNISPVGTCPPVPTGIKGNTLTNNEIIVFPNPASNNATVGITLTETAKVNITLLNTVGQTIQSNAVVGNVGYNNISLDLNKVPSGLYFYQIKVGENKAITRKFVIEK